MTDITMQVGDPTVSNRRPHLWTRRQIIGVAWRFILLYLLLQVGAGIVAAELEIELGGIGFALLVTVGSAISFFGSVLWVNARQTRYGWRELGFVPAERRWYWLALLLLIPAALRVPLLSWLSEVAPALNIGSEILAEGLTLGPGWELVAGLLLFGPVVSIYEEFFFRGFVFDALRSRVGMWPTILVSAILFGLIHLQPLQMIGAIFLGILLGWLRERSGSLWPPIVMHIINNVFWLALASFFPTMLS